MSARNLKKTIDYKFIWLDSNIAVWYKHEKWLHFGHIKFWPWPLTSIESQDWQQRFCFPGAHFNVSIVFHRSLKLLQRVREIVYRAFWTKNSTSRDGCVQGRINHCAGCTMGGVPPPPRGPQINCRFFTSTFEHANVQCMLKRNDDD